jgi:hypothetical protein
MANIFFDLVNMKHLQVLSYKDKEETLKAKVAELETELKCNKNKTKL